VNITIYKTNPDTFPIQDGSNCDTIGNGDDNSFNADTTVDGIQTNVIKVKLNTPGGMEDVANNAPALFQEL